jgi:D-aminopeptidase
MKNIIACDDMEGITGVNTLGHCNPTHPAYQRFRKQMTMDVMRLLKALLLAGLRKFRLQTVIPRG